MGEDGCEGGRAHGHLQSRAGARAGGAGGGGGGGAGGEVPLRNERGVGALLGGAAPAYRFGARGPGTEGLPAEHYERLLAPGAAAAEAAAAAAAARSALPGGRLVVNSRVLF